MNSMDCWPQPNTAANEMVIMVVTVGEMSGSTILKNVLPLSKAMLGVILLYYAVSYWNNFTSSLYFQPLASDFHSLQMVLKQMLLEMQNIANADGEMAEYYANLYNQIKYSVIVVGSLPLMILYPFLQKYFDKGVMMGSVKG